jgi:glycosyltransferase involved in cell wall biosynthesis
MRVLLITALYPPVLGGAELQAQRLARELDRRGVGVTVLTRPRREAPMYERDGGVSVVRGLSALPLGPLWGLTYMLSAQRWVRRLAAGADVVHSQQVALHCWPAMRVARTLRKPCLLRFACYGAGGDLAALSRHRFGGRLVAELRSADRLIALTAGGVGEIRGYGLPAERIRRIPNGVDLDRFAVQAWPQVSDSEPLRLLFVGRLSRQKGTDVLLHALALQRQRARFHLRVVGVGGEEQSLRAQSASLGLEGFVEFCGSQENMLQHYAWSELVVLPSRFEGMPNVILEAMSCARPVLGTSVDGTSELLAGGQCGWLVPAGDAAALAQGLERVVQERAALRSRGLAGRTIVERGYSMSRTAERYLQEYEAMLATKPGP